MDGRTKQTNLVERRNNITAIVEKVTAKLEQGFGRKKDENRTGLFLRFIVFFFKRPPLMFHLSYQNVGKILNMEKPPGGRR